VAAGKRGINRHLFPPVSDKAKAESLLELEWGEKACLHSLLFKKT
jgi:hypothetical protein